nr:alkaline phosphatase-like [Onthophagus taurus]
MVVNDLFVFLAFFVTLVFSRPDFTAHDYNPSKHLHVHKLSIRSVEKSINEEDTIDYWRAQAQKTLRRKLIEKPNRNRAKNVILFLGDGMSIPTLKAARIYMGQLQNKSGENSQLAFEKFPHTALSKTYCVDSQVPDSACTSTAYVTGVKANEGTLGVTAAVQLNDCEGSLKKENRPTSIAYWSQLKGKRTGFVTTTRVTHASPAGLYSHSANRDWESDAYETPSECKDIAYQLINEEIGKNFNVIMGGGRREMIPEDSIDEEFTNGTRKDGKNLINQWITDKSNENAKYVWNRTSLLQLEESPDYLLGLFEGSHCKYHLDADEEDPSLSEMTEAAIKVLSKKRNQQGFFLFVEGGRIDHAHHDSLAKKALDETVEFSKAIDKALEMTDEKETLIVVTSDHAHVMTVSGYARRGNDIFGDAGVGDDGINYSTLSYANGPGYRKPKNNTRFDHSKDDKHDKDYLFPTMVPLEFETHGGDDVAIFANGPWAHLFNGVIEQNVIPHILGYASCVGNGITVCDDKHN